jgi:phosphoglycolate phosphatase
MSKKIIVFDLDGVLCDTIRFVRENLANIYNGFTEEAHKELMNGNFHEEIKKITLPKKEETKAEAADRRLKFEKRKSEAPLYPGAQEFLKELHAAGYTLVLNTSAWDRTSRPLLERVGITDLFDFIATAETSKSKVEKFKIIAKKYAVQNYELLFITDTMGDVREAEEAGVSTVAVTWGGHDRDYLTREKHENMVAIVDSFEELKAFIVAN